MTDHRAEAEQYLAQARETSDRVKGTDDYDSLLDPTQLGILHTLLAIHDVLTELRDDDLDAEEQHQSEKFEATPLAETMTPDGRPTQAYLNRPLDSDIVYGPSGKFGHEDDDTIETRYAIPLDEDDEHDPRHQRPGDVA